MASNLTRRNFLKAASLAAASVPLSKVAARAPSGVVKAPLVAPGSSRTPRPQSVASARCASGAASWSVRSVTVA